MDRDMAPRESSRPLTPVRVRRLLAGVTLGWLALTLVGLVVLWPSGDRRGVDSAALGFTELVPGNVIRAAEERCSFSPPEDPVDCNVATVEITGGPTDGETTVLEFPIEAGDVPLREGDRIVLNYAEDAPPEARYQFADFQRRTPLVVLAVLFAAAVVALGRLRGLAALGGLMISVAVLLWFLLPALLEGSNPVAVALTAGSAIAFAALYLAHGVNERTTVALLGTLASLLLTAVLALTFAAATNLTGLAGEETGFLRAVAGDLDFRGLLLAGILIGSLGVLDDVTVTQVSAVGEVAVADPTMNRRALYSAGLRIGRDHIASTVNTLVLAYAGAALPLMLLLVVAGRSLGSVLTGEVIALEIVRTLVGSIGLVASVPITTALAAWLVSRSTAPDSGPPMPPTPSG